MVTATIGLGLLLLVTVSSIAIVRRGLRYELWYAVHLTAYAGIALAWFHQIPTGGDLNALPPERRRYWRALFFGTLASSCFRVACRSGGAPSGCAWPRCRRRARRDLGPHHRPAARRAARRGPASSSCGGSSPSGFWWKAHPFSLSAAPEGRSLRITSRPSATTRADAASSRPATAWSRRGRSATSPSRRRGAKALLIAGGIGITPVRAMLEAWTETSS